ncbi:DUF1772 domain-containing protein [uncultured Pseudonocardia sp.]|uniref:DUF1772 domain-containing protein n=1 Tax=uncultured Pseudonocardia sp. TaxID=211455 RepID=UPI002637CF11|nr:DUF1772 domain-containing protein [uncultured Pseudonocardia sp.]
MTVLAVLLPVVVLANGLAAGVLMGTQLGGWPLLAELPADRYVHAHAFFATRYDPFMPVCLLVTVLGDAALAVLAGGPARVLTAVAAVLAAATVLISLTKNVPINRWVRTLDPDHLPADFDRHDPRPHWGVWNTLRAALTTLALMANCIALGGLVAAA